MKSAEEYRHLWTDDRQHWALKVVRNRDGAMHGYLIYNMRHSTALLIEDNAVAKEVTEMMLRSGCKVIDA